MGVRGGRKAVVHAVQALLQQDVDNLCFVQVDYINAFNLADRGMAYEEVKKHFPELSHLVANCYGVAAKLVYGDSIIHSTRGFHQGDVVATLLFSLLNHPVVLKIQEQVLELLLNGWILDDGALGGPAAAVARALGILFDESPKHGLVLSTQLTVPSDPKCTV